jgi:ATP-binding cassette subfamily C (CFTR/MRP) protein 1
MIQFLIYVIISRSQSSLELNPETIFTSLSLISLLSTPMQNFATALPLFVASLSCYTRIQEFLTAGSRHPGKNAENIYVPDPPSSHEPPISFELTATKPKMSSTAQPEDIFGVNDASFAFPSTTLPVLKNVSVRINAGTLTLVTGPTGSGKTAFLEALLGELFCTEGRVTLDNASIGYCAQNPWLPNATIRDIILTSNEYDDEWYRSTLYACMLEQDLKSLPDGDGTFVGNKGTKLSGGQKQRVVSALLPINTPSNPTDRADIGSGTSDLFEKEAFAT